MAAQRRTSQEKRPAPNDSSVGGSMDIPGEAGSPLNLSNVSNVSNVGSSGSNVSNVGSNVSTVASDAHLAAVLSDFRTSIQTDIRTANEGLQTNLQGACQPAY